MRARLRLLLAMLARPGIDDVNRLFGSSSPAATNDAYLLSALLVHDVRERYGATVPGAIAARVATGVGFVEAFRAETGITPDAAAAQAWAGYRRWTAWMPAVASPSTAWAVILLLAGMAFLVQRRRRTHRRREWDEEEEL
jgi:MYXO-CTERM domain-containing protein